MLEISYRRLFELAENKLVTVANAKVMGWGESWEAWRWCGSPYAWEDELLTECVDRLANVICRWKWRIGGCGIFVRPNNIPLKVLMGT